MPRAIDLLFPCCAVSHDKTVLIQPAAKHVISALAISVIAGLATSLASFFLIKGLLGPTLLTSIATLGAGSASYLFLRFAYGSKTTPLLPQKTLSAAKVDTVEPFVAESKKDWSGLILQNVYVYPGDLSELEKNHLQAEYEKLSRLRITLRNHPGLEITIRCQDLFESGAQTIVNAANAHLGGGGGIDGLIHSKGGNSYAQEHQELQKHYQSKFISGHAACIGSGELKHKYNIDSVIVVAGPQGSTDTAKETALYSCYYNSLLLAHQQDKTSIAFPSISTGIFGFPVDRAARISLKALFDFCNTHPDTCLKTISIHFLNAAELDFYKKAVDKII